MATKKDNNSDAKIAIGVGAGMLAALSAGAYYLYGTKDASKKRTKIRGWVLKAKGEMMEKLENLKEVNEEAYNSLISNVTKKYKGVKNIDPVEVESLISDFKKHWKNIKKDIDSANKTPKKIAPKKK